MDLLWPVGLLWQVVKEPRVRLLELASTTELAFGRNEKSLDLKERALELRVSKYGSSAKNTFLARISLAKRLNNSGERDQAMEQLVRVVSDSRSLPAGDREPAGVAQYMMATMLVAAKQYDAAIDALSEAAQIHEATNSVENMLTAKLLLADILSRQGKFDESIPLAMQVRDIRVLRSGESDPNSLMTNLHLASQLHGSGEDLEARRVVLSLLEAGSKLRRRDSRYREAVHTSQEGAMDPNRILDQAEQLLSTIEEALSSRGPEIS